MDLVDYRKGEKITGICLLGNILLSFLKAVAGVLGGSQALVADAVHSATDVVATTVVYLGIKIARRPVDRNHPYGHGKVEHISAAFVGLTLFIASYAILRGVVEVVVARSFTTPSLVALLAALVSITAKEVMFRATYATGVRLRSDSMVANAWDHRADAYSSIGVAVGITGAMVGGHWGVETLRYLDPLAGGVVAVLIVRSAFFIMRNALVSLMDTLPEEETMANVKEAVRVVDGVLEITWVKGRRLGRHLLIDLAIEVDPKKTVGEGHEIADSVRERVMDEFKEIGDVLVHVNPYRDE